MILNGNQRGGAKDLALHLMKAENERVEVHELRGFMSSDLLGAFNEMHAISRATRCQQFMYSLSLNPPKGESVSVADFMRAIDQAEKQLGLTGQPRAVVFHEKNGRRHCHVVWSRIDISRMKAVQLSHDREKLTALSREIFLEYGWNMPRGLEVRGERNPTNYTHAEHQQAQPVGKNAGQMKVGIQAAWAQSDNLASLEAALAELGYVLAKGGRRDFVLVDRDGEVYSLPRIAGVKTKDIRARLGDGADLPTIAQVVAQWVQQYPDKPSLRLDYTPESALVRITRHHAAFTQTMMDRTLKSVMPHDAERTQLIHDILHSNAVVKIGTHNGRDVYSIPEMIDLERRMVDTASGMTGKVSHPVHDYHVKKALFNLDNHIARETGGKARLSNEQKQAIRHMTSDKQLALVVGVAGAGKTTIMAGAKEALEAQGYRVRGAAPSGVAAAALRGIGIPASTLHSLEARMQLAQQMMDDNAGKPLSQKQKDFISSAMLNSKDVLIVDEAGMVSAKQLSRIMELTRQSGAKLVLVGDPAQLQSIEAGAAFRTLLERNNSVSLTELRRQEAQWQREATQALSQGDVSQALHAYDMYDCIHRHATRSDAKTQLVTDVMAAQDAAPQASCLVLAYTRVDVADLNAMIKAEMVERGKVSFTDMEIAVTVKDADGERTKIQGFAVGDRIAFRENNRDLGVMNGSFGTLQVIKGEHFHVVLDNGKAVNFSPHDYNRFQLGYAATVHQSQGMTVDRAFVLATPHFDRHTTYVAMSRHKEQVMLYASDGDFKTPAKFYQSLGKEGEKLSTLDFTDTQEKSVTPECDPAPECKSPSKQGNSLWDRMRDRLQGKTQNTPEPEHKLDSIQQPLANAIKHDTAPQPEPSQTA